MSCWVGSHIGAVCWKALSSCHGFFSQCVASVRIIVLLSGITFRFVKCGDGGGGDGGARRCMGKEGRV